LNVSGMNDDGDQQTQRFYEEMPFPAVDFLARVVTMASPFSVVFADWRSIIAAFGARLRPTD
jgi:hypothetical protein